MHKQSLDTAGNSQERGFIATTSESYVYYVCQKCGSASIPAFHWQGDWLYSFHAMFSDGKPQAIETGEAYLS